MTDTKFPFELSVDELAVVDEALKEYWTAKCAALGTGPSAARGIFAALGPAGSAGKEMLEKQIAEKEKEFTRKARTADQIRQRIEPLVEEHEATSKVQHNAGIAR